MTADSKTAPGKTKTKTQRHPTARTGNQPQIQFCTKFCLTGARLIYFPEALFFTWYRIHAITKNNGRPA